MKKNLLLVCVFAAAVFICTNVNAQSGNVGIGTALPGSKLTVNGSFAADYKTGTATVLGENDFYYAWNGAAAGTLSLPVAAGASPTKQGRVYHIKNTGTAILTVAATGMERIDNQSGTGITSISLQAGYYVMFICKNNTAANGVATQWEVAVVGTVNPVTDATRFVGGSIIVPGAFADPVSYGTIANANWVSQAAPAVVTTGAPSAISSDGSVISTTPNTNNAGALTAGFGAVGTNGKGIYYGTGYTITNPSAGNFIITFSTPFGSIYGVTTNVYDVYQSTASGTQVGGYNNNIPGTVLNQLDNAQITYISNNSIRIRTGNRDGAWSNRSFTFVVIGK